MCLCISGNFYFYRSSQADCLTLSLTYYHTFIVSLITKFEGVVEGMHNVEESFVAWKSTSYFIYYARICMTIVQDMQLHDVVLLGDNATTL